MDWQRLANVANVGAFLLMLYPVTRWFWERFTMGGDKMWPGVLLGFFLAACVLWGVAYSLSRRAEALVLPSPCQVRMSDTEVHSLVQYLGQLRTSLQKRGQARRVRIYVEHGKMNVCPYAADLKRVFEEAGWKLEYFEERENAFIRGGLWLHSAKRDSDALDLYQMLDRLTRQEIHYVEVPDLGPTTMDVWEFYLKDEWTNRKL